MAYSQQIADRLREIFASMNVNASFEEKANCGIFATRLKLRCRLQSAQMVILVREDSFSTLTTIPLAADEGNRLAVAEYLTRVNFNMRNGNRRNPLQDVCSRRRGRCGFRRRSSGHHAPVHDD